MSPAAAITGYPTFGVAPVGAAAPSDATPLRQTRGAGDTLPRALRTRDGLRPKARERPLHLTQPPHDVMDAAGHQSLLRAPEPGSLLAEHVLHGDANARVANVAMRRPPPASVAQDRDGPDLDARSLRRDDDLRRSPVRLGVRVGDRHHDPERRPLRTRREPLV